MESEQRGRASRASSTSSLGREVRCGCQYYQSDSLLPERRALQGRPSSRTMQQPPAVRCSEHEYEPIAAPSPLPHPVTAPVVRITETDVVPVVDSDDSIDDRTRLPPELTKEGDVVLPLDGKIEDSAMEGRELVETGDTSEELETPQQMQERIEERFLNTATPGTESRTDGEVNTSQVDSLTLEELPLRRDARGLPQRIKTQAGKLRSRLRSMQRPSFMLAGRQRSEKPRSNNSGKSDKSRAERRPSRMDRIRSSISEKTKFNLPSRPKFNLPDRSKFHLPQRPKFNLPERPKFHLPERPKFNIKKPNIRLPGALTRARKSSVPQPRSTDSTISSSRRNIFDFSTYPRIFEKKTKAQPEYATSTPKDSRAQSAESATFPRARKETKWVQRFNETAYIDEDRPDAETAAERARPWRHPSAEEPRLSVRMEEEILAAARAIPWEERRRHEQEEELQYMDYEQESPESSEQQPHPRSQEESRTEEESYERERVELSPRLYDDQPLKEMYPRVRKDRDRSGQVDWHAEEEMIRGEGDFTQIPRSRSLGESVSHLREEERYEETFGRGDPRRFGPPKLPSEEEEYEEEMEEGDEEQEPSSAQSDREQQQSSGSSCDRRRRGVIEEIDSDEFFLRESGLSQDDMNLGKYIAHEIRDALRSEGANVFAEDDVPPVPPQRPVRTRSLKKRKEDSVESYDAVPPTRPKRERSIRRSEEPEFRERTRSDSRHRVVYQAEAGRELTQVEPLDDIVVVKPMRRKSRSSGSQSQGPTDPSSVPLKVPIRPPSPPPLPSSTPPAVPVRRKRLRRVVQRNGDAVPVCNGHAEWVAADSAPEKPLPLPPTAKDLLDDQEVLTADEIIAASEEDFQKLAMRLREEEYMEPVPVAPKRRSRSRGPSMAQDEDRTSHGAESLPEAGYVQEDIPRDDVDSARDLSGYAIVEKREKPPRPPPPRRKKDKFATAPRVSPPKRPQRAYSTLGPSKSREANILFEPIGGTLEPAEPGSYIEIEDDEAEHKDLRSGEVLSKMQGRPLPAPPRPPRIRKEQSLEHATRSLSEFATETTTATQTDPLPDDMVIEEEITQAKLIVAPSRSGSQIMVSTERIPSPGSMTTPSVPPLPVIQRARREEPMEPSYDTVSLTSPSPIREHEDMEGRHLSAPDLEHRRPTEETREHGLRSVLLTDEPVRIGSLEVGDLRVDRLSVSQIEASKIVASEVDALVITASELKSIGGQLEENLSPSIIRELIAIRSHLETVTVAQAQERHAESGRTAEAQIKTDIPITDSEEVRESRPQETSSDTVADQLTPTEDERSKPGEDQKVVKTEIVPVKDKETPVTHTLSVAQITVKDKEIPVAHTLSVSQIESKDKEIHSKHSALSVVQGTEDKSLRILDSERPLSLSSTTGKEPTVGDSRASRPSSVTALPEEESRLSPERTSEFQSDEQLELKKGDHRIDVQLESTDSTEQRGSRARTTEKECSLEKESAGEKLRKSRSRSPSPIKGMGSRQTASPVRSLPPAISVTPDTPDTVTGHSIASEMQPQRAVISYSSHAERSEGESQRESSQSPICFPSGGTHFIAFPASQIPAQFFSITEQTSHVIDSDPGVVEVTKQLLRALRLTGIRAMRQLIGNLSLAVSGEESREKIREVELTICALLLLIAGLLLFFFISPRTVTHHHHWDYFNPPQ